jgi:glycopeptide antibiotics resistance protein
MINYARIAIAARVVLPLYLAVVFWIVFSPADEATTVTSWVAAILEAIDDMRQAYTPAYVVLEFVANVGMFVPFGVLVWLAFLRPRWWIVVTAGFATTITIELVQRTMPTRYSTLSDVIANTLGTAIGLLLVHAVAARAVRRRE